VVAAALMLFGLPRNVLGAFSGGDSSVGIVGFVFSIGSGVGVSRDA
jgi:hypothetical protein